MCEQTEYCEVLFDTGKRIAETTGPLLNRSIVRSLFALLMVERDWPGFRLGLCYRCIFRVCFDYGAVGILPLDELRNGRSLNGFFATDFISHYGRGDFMALWSQERSSVKLY